MCMHLLQCNCARAACRQHTHTCACICCSVTVCAQQMGMHATHTHTHSSAGGPVPPQIIHVRAQQMGMQAIHTANNNALTRQMGMHAIAVLTALTSTIMCTHAPQILVISSGTNARGSFHQHALLSHQLRNAGHVTSTAVVTAVHC